MTVAYQRLEQHRAGRRANAQGMVPLVWIEQTTYRLQGGCSTTELKRPFSRLLPIIRLLGNVSERDRRHYPLSITALRVLVVTWPSNYKTAALPAELSRLACSPAKTTT